MATTTTKKRNSWRNYVNSFLNRLVCCSFLSLVSQSPSFCGMCETPYILRRWCILGARKQGLKKTYLYCELCIHAHTVVTRIVINIHLLKYYFFIFKKKNDICKPPKSNIVTAFNIYRYLCILNVRWLLVNCRLPFAHSEVLFFH